VDEDIFYAGVAGQAGLIRESQVSSRQFTSALLARIRQHDDLLNAFTAVLDEQALTEADARDAETGRGDVPPLHGVAVAIKEEIDVAGQVTNFGGRANVRPAVADSEVVRRLRGAGAIVIGRTAMPEFGQWPFTESVAHGITRNPWDTEKSPGGSSGGTAVAVAAAWFRSRSAATVADRSGSRPPAVDCSASSRSVGASRARRMSICGGRWGRSVR
jgi:amidase